jgi:hypothetical protein
MTKEHKFRLIQGESEDQKKKWKELHVLWKSKELEWSVDQANFDECIMMFRSAKAKWEKDPESFNPPYSKAYVDKMEKDIKKWGKQIKERAWVESTMLERFGYTGLKQSMRELKKAFNEVANKTEKLTASILGRPNPRLILVKK